MKIPDDLRYTEDHEWLREENDGTFSVGITDHAQEQLGDVVFVQTPAVGRRVVKGEECGVIESVKAAADIHAPLSGEIVAFNEALADNPEKINEDPYAAWMFRLRLEVPSERAGLLDAVSYRAALTRSA